MMNCKIAAVISFMSMAYISSAQADMESKYFWMEANGAIGSAWLGDVGLNVEYGNFLYTIERQGFGNGYLLGSAPPTTLHSYNALIGKIFKGDITYSAVSVGLGFGQYAEPFEAGTEEGLFFTRTRYEMERKNVITLPIEFKAGIAAKVVSLQMKTGLNINSAHSMFYLGLGLGFGKMY